MSDNPNDLSLPLMTHLREVRDRVLRVVIAVSVIFLALWFLMQDAHQILTNPIMAQLKDGDQMIATGVASGFLVPFKMTLVLSAFIAMPYILFQIWGFVAPALYQHERKLAIPLLLSSILLFYVGIAFCYFVVMPIVFGFFAGFVPEGIAYMPDISNHLDFSIKLFFVFGIAFEVPIAIILLVWTGITDVQSLKQKRSYIFLGCFVIGMLVTPPDVISQTILAIPMYLLFELGLLAGGFITKRNSDDTEASEN